MKAYIQHNLCSIGKGFVLFWIGCMLLATVSCRKDANTASKTGSIALAIHFKDRNAEYRAQHIYRATGMVCADTGISKVTVYVYDENNNQLGQGGPWDCDLHGGVVGDIDPGTNRKVLVLGLDPNSEVMYWGTAQGIEVVSGKTTNQIDITVIETYIQNFAAKPGQSQISLTWNSVSGAAAYDLYWSNSADLSKTNYTGLIENIADNSYNHVNLINGTTYYYLVFAKNEFGFQGFESDQVDGLPGNYLHVPADYQTIQEAIDASTDGDYVLVADNTYSGTGNVDIDFNGKRIVVKSENGPQNCIINCSGSGRAFRFHSNEGSQSKVEGFTIQNGKMDYDIGGGAISCENASPTITKCVFDGNLSYATPGGGISCILSSPTISFCIFKNNQADGGDGGAISCDNASPVILNCAFINNTTSENGGAIHCSGPSNPTITNCTIIRNTAGGSGGGISCDYGKPSIINTIVYDNAGEQIAVLNGDGPTVIYSDIQGRFTGEGNIDEDPLFVDFGDYHLAFGSPCIDKGTSYGAPSTDLDEDSRPNGEGYDIGADEHTP